MPTHWFFLSSKMNVSRRQLRSSSGLISFATESQFLLCVFLRVKVASSSKTRKNLSCYLLEEILLSKIHLEKLLRWNEEMIYMLAICVHVFVWICNLK